MNLATARYKLWTPDMGVPVATTVGKRGLRAELLANTCNLIAPYGIFNAKPEPTEAEFRARYKARLDDKATEIDAALAGIADRHPGRALVILCWCSITDVDGYCHRRMAATWLEARYGGEVPELTLEGSPRPAPPPSDDQGTLF